MALQTFKLESGADLQVDEAPFEVAIALVEVVKKIMLECPQGVREMEIGDAVASDARARKAVMDAAAWALYDTRKVDAALFNDATLGVKARGDYFQIMRYIIEVNTHPFFRRTSSGSTPPGEVPLSVQQ